MNKIVILMILIESFFSKPRKGDHEATKEAIPAAAAAEFEGEKHCPRYAGDKSKHSGQASDGANDQSRRQPRRSQ